MKNKIMVVDDELEVIKLLEIKLKEWGYDVIATDDPNKCIQMVKKERPHLVLLDIMMPDLDGISVCSELRKTCNVPVIIVSALGDFSARHDAELFGAFEYIIKPIDDEELKTKIEKVLKLHQK